MRSQKIILSVCLLLTLVVGSTSLAAQTAHRLPAPAKPATEPIDCVGNNDVVLSNRFIHTSGHGVVASCNGDVRIVDSHIVADGIGILVEGNGDVEVIDSFVQGAQGALVLTGNSDVNYRDSTLRGGRRATGNGELFDDGGNVLERIPAAPPDLLVRGEPVSCAGSERIEVVGRYIETDGDAITVAGRCEVLVSDSFLVARGAAIRVVGEGSVRLRNSTVEGGVAAVRLADDGYLHAAGSNLEGAIDLGAGSPRFADGGGNSTDRRGSHRGASHDGRDPGRARTATGGGGRWSSTGAEPLRITGSTVDFAAAQHRVEQVRAAYFDVMNQYPVGYTCEMRSPELVASLEPQARQAWGRGHVLVNKTWRGFQLTAEDVAVPAAKPLFDLVFGIWALTVQQTLGFVEARLPIPLLALAVEEAAAPLTHEAFEERVGGLVRLDFRARSAEHAVQHLRLELAGDHEIRAISLRSNDGSGVDARFTSRRSPLCGNRYLVTGVTATVFEPGQPTEVNHLELDYTTAGRAVVLGRLAVRREDARGRLLGEHAGEVNPVSFEFRNYRLKSQAGP